MKHFMKNSTKAGICAGLIFLAFIATGCDEKSKGSAGFQRAAGIKDSKLSMNSYASSYMPEAAFYDSDEFVMEEAVAQSSVELPEFVEGGKGDNYERKLIRTGNVSLEVKTVSDAEEKIASWAKGLGGYVTNANIWENGANFTVRIPSIHFDDAMAQAGDFGRVTERSVNSQDVSDNYYDLEARLKTKYIMRDKLSGYLSQAKDIKDLLEIERQLNQVLEEIDSTESRFKRLAGQVDYSTIYINMQFERGKDEGGIILPNVKDSWNEFVSNVIGFFWGLLKVLFYIVIFGIPVVAVVAFFFWLLFGKVGLLVKLFKKLKK